MCSKIACVAFVPLVLFLTHVREAGADDEPARPSVVIANFQQPLEDKELSGRFVERSMQDVKEAFELLGFDASLHRIKPDESGQEFLDQVRVRSDESKSSDLRVLYLHGALSSSSDESGFSGLSSYDVNGDSDGSSAIPLDAIIDSSRVQVGQRLFMFDLVGSSNDEENIVAFDQLAHALDSTGAACLATLSAGSDSWVNLRRRRGELACRLSSFLSGDGPIESYANNRVECARLADYLAPGERSGEQSIPRPTYRFHVTTAFLQHPAMAQLMEYGDADWPQFWGGDRNNKPRLTDLDFNWSEGNPPAKLWMYDRAGSGFSGPAIIGDRLYIMVLREREEFLACLDVTDGSELWVSRTGPTMDPRCCCFPGPRGTPTIIGARAVCINSGGAICCFNSLTGRRIWTREFHEFGGAPPMWGAAESPYIDGNLVLCTPGGEQGAVVALDLRNGKKLWQISEIKDGAAYSSIVRIGQNKIGESVFGQLFTKSLAVFDAHGRLLDSAMANHPLQSTSPIPLSDNEFLAASQSGTERYTFRPASGKLIRHYSGGNSGTYHQGAVAIGRRCYFNPTTFSVMDIDSGAVVKRQRLSIEKGPILGNKEALLCVEQARTKEVCKVACFTEATASDPQVFFLKPRSSKLNTKDYRGIVTHPVIANGKLFIRDNELLHCYDLKK